MITPSAMELLSFVVLKDKAEEMASQLLKLGIFHPVDIRSIEDKIKGLSIFQIQKETGDLETLQAKTADITRKLKLNWVPTYSKDIEAFSYAGTEELLNNLDKELTPLLTQKDELQEEIKTEESILSHVKEYLPFPLERKSLYSFLEVSTGRIEEKNILVLERSLKGIPHVIYPFKKESDGGVFALVIGLRRDRVLIEKVLDDVAWDKKDFPLESEGLSKAAQKKLTMQIEENKKKIKDVESQIRDLGGTHREALSRINSFITLKRSLLEARKYSYATEKTVLFSGWVPREEKAKLINKIKSLTDISYVESRSPEQVEVSKDEIPVRFQHGPLIKPFELLIEAYGVPRYGSIDPTIFVAISFLIMFGAMFGDLGHGLFLILVSFFLRRKKLSNNLKHTGALIFYCGISSSVFGILYGSFLGFEFNSLWIKPMGNILEIFKASIFLGITIITLGILINVLNALRDRDYVKALFDKAGLIGGIIYWAAIGLVSKLFFFKGTIPAFYSFLILGGILVLFLYPLMECILKKRFGNIMESFMESLVNILEIFMGYLANTVSFIRVAAFALAHAGLFIAIFSFSQVIHIKGNLGDILYWLVIITGNIIVVALEGLICSIQSLRLNYYEFFSKFFMSGKQMYKPLSV
jgi:V/A-type H+-transporting ATPase subunit I